MSQLVAKALLTATALQQPVASHTHFQKRFSSENIHEAVREFCAPANPNPDQMNRIQNYFEGFLQDLRTRNETSQKLTENSDRNFSDSKAGHDISLMRELPSTHRDGLKKAATIVTSGTQDLAIRKIKDQTPLKNLNRDFLLI